jgi:hypothetical protein
MENVALTLRTTEISFNITSLQEISDDQKISILPISTYQAFGISLQIICGSLEEVSLIQANNSQEFSGF